VTIVPPQPAVTISILHWNDEAATDQCLASVLADPYQPRKIVVTDNGSTAALSARIKDKYPSVIFLRNSENLGFAGGHNQLLRDPAILGDSSYVWILNNDAVIVPGCLQTLVTTSSAQPNMGLASPSICYTHAPEEIEFLAASVDFSNWTNQRLRDPQVISDICKNDAAKIWLAGTALLISRRALAAGMLFDERYFAYYEDNDISIQSIRHGLVNMPVAAAKILHRAPADNTERAAYYHYLMSRNSWLFWRKHLRQPRQLAALYFEYMARTIISAAQLLPSSPSKSSAVIRGAYDALTGKTGRPPGLGAGYPRWALKALLFAPYKKAACLRAIGKAQQFFAA
jgi:GT2 family glycosyltransferase